MFTRIWMAAALSAAIAISIGMHDEGRSASSTNNDTLISKTLALNSSAAASTDQNDVRDALQLNDLSAPTEPAHVFVPIVFSVKNDVAIARHERGERRMLAMNNYFDELSSRRALLLMRSSLGTGREGSRVDAAHPLRL